MLPVYQIQTFELQPIKKIPKSTPYAKFTTIKNHSVYKHYIMPPPSSYNIKCKFYKKVSPYLFHEYGFSSFRK